MLDIIRQKQILQNILTQKQTQPLNFETHSESVTFNISPAITALPDGIVEAIRVQDIDKNVFFEYNRATGWTSPPEVTVGTGTLYIAAYYYNLGGPGKLFMGINDDVGNLVFKEEYVEYGGYVGIETGTIDMPNRVYGIDVDVSP